jgi:hypothetical protein
MTDIIESHKKLLILNSGEAQGAKSKVFVPHLPLLGIARTVVPNAIRHDKRHYERELFNFYAELY